MCHFVHNLPAMMGLKQEQIHQILSRMPLLLSDNNGIVGFYTIQYSIMCSAQTPDL